MTPNTQGEPWYKSDPVIMVCILGGLFLLACFFLFGVPVLDYAVRKWSNSWDIKAQTEIKKDYQDAGLNNWRYNPKPEKKTE